MNLHSVLVTGANRGIGLEFVRQLSRLQMPPRYIFATYRCASSVGALKEIKDASKDSNVVLIEMDVTKLEDIIAARKVIEQEVKENGLSLLINNAGVVTRERFPDMTEDALLSQFTLNTLGPIRVFQEMLPLLEKAASKRDLSHGLSASRAAVLNMSSLAGSITRTEVEVFRDTGSCGYKTSKAALNMAMRVIAANVKSKGILVVNMCPGWVKTDLGGQQAEISPEESICTMLQTLPKLNDTHQGAFLNRFGIPYAF